MIKFELVTGLEAIGPDWFPFRIQLIVSGKTLFHSKTSRMPVTITQCRLAEYHGRKRFMLLVDKTTLKATLRTPGFNTGIPVTLN